MRDEANLVLFVEEPAPVVLQRSVKGEAGDDEMRARSGDRSQTQPDNSQTTSIMKPSDALIKSCII